MQHRVTTLWSRLVESGINQLVQRQTADLYKAARSEWFRRMQLTRDGAGEDDGGRSAMWLFAVVLGIGHSAAVVAFLAELVWFRF